MIDTSIEVDEGPTTKDWIELVVVVVIFLGGIAIRLFA